MHVDAGRCCEDGGPNPSFTGLPLHTPSFPPQVKGLKAATAALHTPGKAILKYTDQTVGTRDRKEAHQDSNGFRQGPVGPEAVLGVLGRVLPLQAQRSEGPARGFLALGAEDEASGHLVLHRWPGRGTEISVSSRGVHDSTIQGLSRRSLLMFPVSLSP